MSSDAEERLTALEMRIAYQDDTIEQLNEVVTESTRLVDRLQKRLDELEAQIKSGGSPAGDAPADDPPPHY